MKYYLSSYQLGSHVEKFRKMTQATNRKVAYIANARDYEPNAEKIKEDIDGLEELDLEVTNIDLKKYFGKEAILKKELEQYDIFWVRGGNVFVLRQAMHLSGFDSIIIELHNTNTRKIYGGYSAGACVLSPTLAGLEIVDDITANPYNQKEVILDGLNIINYAISPHYKSDHPESADVDLEVADHIRNKRLFKALRDGEVIIIE